MKIVVLNVFTLNLGDLDWKGVEAIGECTVYNRNSLTDTQKAIDRIGDAGEKAIRAFLIGNKFYE